MNSLIAAGLPQNQEGEHRWVWARDPFGAGFVRLSVNRTTFEKIIQWGARAKMGEFWGLVHGRPGPMPMGYAPVINAGLMQPTAIFRGLKRPLHYVDARADSQIVVYVTDPNCSYEFRNSREGNALLQTAKPIDAVFTTFVSFAPEHLDDCVANMQHEGQITLQGAILFWEWTESCPNNPRFPYDHENRYVARLQP